MSKLINDKIKSVKTTSEIVNPIEQSQSEQLEFLQQLKNSFR
jgi:beta-lactamase class D